MLKTNILIKLIITLIFSLFGYIVNHFDLTIGYGVSFLFGNIFAFVVTLLLGPWWGALSGIAISSHTIALWNHPYVIIITAINMLTIGFIFKKNKLDLLLAETLFWVLAGFPMIYFFYAKIMQVPLTNVSMMGLKQAINGVLNLILASLIFILISKFKILRIKLNHSELSFRIIFNNLMALFVLIPLLSFIWFTSNNQNRAIEKTITNFLETETIKTKEILEDWLNLQIRGVIAATNLVQNQKKLIPSNQLQNNLKNIKQFFPDLHNIYLANSRGVTFGFYPEINQKENQIILLISQIVPIMLN